MDQTNPNTEAPRVLYPPIEPYHSDFLKVGGGHTIYYEESGNPQGIPIVFVHGGPGSGTDAKQRRYFDPAIYRIILFDQRGCGKSTPYASLRHNTTWDLVRDMEKLRKKLGITKWHLFGGSWGSTLVIAYAETHPQAVSAMILRGIFLCRKSEIDWTYQRGADAVFPDAYEDFRKLVPQAERDDMLRAYRKICRSKNAARRLEGAKSWSIFEGRISRHVPNPDFVSRYGSDDFAVAFAKIEMHYFAHLAWLEDNQLLKNIGRIRHIPCVIVQGRYDMVCPIETAWELHRAWPEAEFVIVGDAGHSIQEPGITSAVIAATDKFAGKQ